MPRSKLLWQVPAKEDKVVFRVDVGVILHKAVCDVQLELQLISTEGDGRNGGQYKKVVGFFEEVSDVAAIDRAEPASLFGLGPDLALGGFGDIGGTGAPGAGGGASVQMAHDCAAIGLGGGGGGGERAGLHEVCAGYLPVSRSWLQEPRRVPKSPETVSRHRWGEGGRTFEEQESTKYSMGRLHRSSSYWISFSGPLLITIPPADDDEYRKIPKAT